MVAKSLRPSSENRMRISSLLLLTLLAGCMASTRGQQQSSVGVGIDIQLGPERSVNSYSADRHGDWRTNYQQWQPTTLYVINGKYYDKEAKGTRAVMVYRHD